MRILWFVWTFLITCNYSTNLVAEELDGNKLIIWCQEAERFVDKDMNVGSPTFTVGAAYCMGLLTGVYTMWQSASNVSDDITMCFPSEIPRTQALRILVKYLRDNPSELHNSDTTLVVKALAEAYACP